MTTPRQPKWPLRLVLAGAVVTVAGVLIMQAPSSTPNASPVVVSDAPVDTLPADPPPVPTEAPLSAADDAKQHDKGWVLESYTPHADDFGGVSTIARVKNVHLTPQTGVFTITLLRGEVLVASFRGSASSVAPGQVVTVEMVTDATAKDVVAGSPKTVEFQTDTTYDD